MGRYYFGLEGIQTAIDFGGLAFESDLDAFKIAKRLATELATARPHLRGNTCVVLTRKGTEDTTWISVI